MSYGMHTYTHRCLFYYFLARANTESWKHVFVDLFEEYVILHIETR
jgi:hypothetical protein